MTSSEQPDPVDEIIAALSRIRGRRPRRHGVHDGTPGAGQHGAHGEWGGRRHAHADDAHASHAREHRLPGGIAGGPARARMLEALAVSQAPLSVTEIAAAVGVDQPRASRLIQQSVQLELVRREADPNDARRTRVVLTDAGRSLASGFRGQRREMIRTALDGLDAAEQSEFLRLLTKFAASWPQADSDR